MPGKKRILLTGASGYLGQHVLQALLADTESTVEVVALAHRSVHRLINAIKPHCTTVVIQSLDIANTVAVQAWLEAYTKDPFHVCVHTAALSSPELCHEQPDLAEAVNVPVSLFQELASKKCRIVAISTDQVYAGVHPPYGEDAELAPCNKYSSTKVQMEQLLQQLDPRCILLRSSIILGPVAPLAPDVAHDTFLHFCKSRRNTETTFYVDERRSVVFIQDVVATIFYFVHHSEDDAIAGIYNMGGQSSVSRMDMAQEVFAHLGYDATLLVAQRKVDVPVDDNSIASPLDISMDSTKLHGLMRCGAQHTFRTLPEMVTSTFPKD